MERNSFQTAVRRSNIQQTGSLAATILFVDDDTEILDAHRLLFEDLGYTVHTADSGEGALHLLTALTVDAVVVDYLMPTMNGEETARRIRGWRGEIPIILFSGSLPLPKPVLKVFDSCVDKGLGSEALVEALESLLCAEESVAQDVVHEQTPG